MGAGDITVDPRFTTFITAYGVTIRLDADDEEIFEQAKTICREAFVGRIYVAENTSGHDLVYCFRRISGSIECELNGEVKGPFLHDSVFELFLNSSLRAQVAAHAKQWVFIHAGVVEWRGKAIVIPGRSFHGKTTLVSELLRAGAGYMSDEFAVINSDGLIHPFDRDLAVRIDGTKPSVRIPPEEFGATRVSTTLEAGMVVFANYIAGSEWRPTTISVGNGILAMVPEIMSVTFNTEFALKVLNTTFNRAIIVKSDRGEARDTAPEILAFFDECQKVGADALV